MWPIAIVGHLKPGWEDIDTINARLSRFFEKLAEVDPLFSRWVRIGTRRHHSIVPAFVTKPPEQTELSSWIDENRIFGSRAGRKRSGWLLYPGTYAGAESDPRRFLAEFPTRGLVVRPPDWDYDLFRRSLSIAARRS